jgi:hypothetical protein
MGWAAFWDIFSQSYLVTLTKTTNLTTINLTQTRQHETKLNFLQN